MVKASASLGAVCTNSTEK